MPTGTVATQAKKYHTDQEHYIAKTIRYTDGSNTITLGVIPAGAVVVAAGVIVGTGFNAGTTNTLDIGTSLDTDGFASAIALGTKGLIVADDMATSDDLGPYASDTTVSCTIAMSGTAASAGVGVVYVRYLIPDRS